MRFATTSLCLFLLVPVVPVFSSDVPKPSAQGLDDRLEPLRARFEQPALAAAVADSRGVLAHGAVGVRKLGSDRTVEIEDRFHVGSCTKAMTATVLATLVEDGELSWDTTVGSVFPDEEAVHAAYRGVTLAQLLLHRSGLPDDRQPDLAVFGKLRMLSGPIDEQRRELVRIVLSTEPPVAAGKEMHYSNYGYSVAGAMAEAVTGKTWEELMRARLFEPAGMVRAGFGPPASPDEIDEPWGHLAGTDEPSPVPPGPFADNPAVLGPAGTVHASIDDFARFGMLHLRAARGASDALSAAAAERLHADPYDQDYAMGWIVVERPWAGGRALMHVGSNGMNMAIIWLVPEKDRVIVAAVNAGDAGSFPALDAVVASLISDFVPQDEGSGDGPGE